MEKADFPRVILQEVVIRLSEVLGNVGIYLSNYCVSKMAEEILQECNSKNLSLEIQRKVVSAEIRPSFLSLIAERSAYLVQKRE